MNPHINLLSILAVIIIIFIIYSYIYGGSNIIFNTNDSDLDNKTTTLELINQAKNNATQKIHQLQLKEKFIVPVDQRIITNKQAEDYLISLNSIDNWINTQYKGSIKDYMATLVNQASADRINNKELVLDTLTNVYIISYIDTINQHNAEAYKVYAKYHNPNTNKYYTQYLK